MENCIFCKIAKKEIPCKKIFENKKIIAFMDVNPVTSGHILVIPKEHYENIFTTPDNILEEINTTCKKMGLLIKEKLNATGVNIMNASGKDAEQSVFHLHYHVVPRRPNDKLNLWFQQETEKQTPIDEIYKRLTS